MKQYNIKINKKNSVFLRTFLIISFFFIAVAYSNLHAQEDLNVIRGNWLRFTDSENSLYHFLTKQAYDLLQNRTNTISKINSLNEWQQRQEFIKKTLLEIVGPFPEKQPLNSKIIRTIEKEDYRIEHIVYESQPGLYVTSSMFIPGDLKGNSKAPAIIYCSGHSAEGYRSAIYLHIIVNLVKKGFIVFAFDPIGQGERYEYLDPETGKSLIPVPNKNEHSYIGCQSFITGSSQARNMIWDGMRAVDYLLSRKEVDSTRIGITGRSGGGTQTSYISAMDDRIYAAAPENYLTNFTRLLQSIGPQDAEQNMFNFISRGLDHPDYLIVRAPKPALMITTSRDMFNIHGTIETENEVSRIYKAYGKEDNFNRIEDDAPHASTKKNREKMYAFFQKHLNNPGDSKDLETQPFDKEEMMVTSTGQVSTSLGGETLYSLTQKEAKKRVSELETAREIPHIHMPRVLESAKKLSGYIEPSSVSEPVFTGRFQREGYVIEKYFVRGEGNYVIPYLLMKPEMPNGNALIYLNPAGKAAEACEGGEIEWFVKNGLMVLAPDLLGIGETGPSDERLNHSYLQKWYASILIGRSIVGIQAGDIVRLTKLLEKQKNISEIYGFARKEMAPVLLHAASFYPAISRVAIVESYSSYLSIITSRFYDVNFIYSTVPAALKNYDITDLAAGLAPAKLLMAGIIDGNGKPINEGDYKNDLSLIRTAYKNKKSLHQLDIIAKVSKNKLADLYSEWIK